MIELQDGMLLYHGSYVGIPKIDLQRYISGADFGIPGTPEADRTAIEKLLPNRLKDQFCFRTQDAIDHLEFLRSDRYGDIKL